MHSPIGEKYAERAAERGKKNALGEQLTDDAAASGADGNAQRHFFLAARRSSKHEAGDVGARDQQNDSDGGHQRVEHRGDPVSLSAKCFLHGQDADHWIVRFVKERFGSVNCFVAENRRNRSLRLRDRDIRPKTTNDRDPEAVRFEQAIPRIPPLRTDLENKREGHVEILEFARREMGEVRVGNTNDHRGCAVEANGSANGAGIGSEGSAPVIVVENDGGGSARRVVGGIKRAAEKHGDAERGEKVAGNVRSVGNRSRATAAKVD